MPAKALYLEDFKVGQTFRAGAYRIDAEAIIGNTVADDEELNLGGCRMEAAAHVVESDVDDEQVENRHEIADQQD